MLNKMGKGEDNSFYNNYQKKFSHNFYMLDDWSHPIVHGWFNYVNC